MAISSVSVSSIELVQPEIETTIEQAEVSLTRFQENRDSSEDLQNCIDCLNQLRGIFVVVEVQGCVLLCQESVALGNEVPVGANEDKNNLLANLSNAIFILRRYTEYFAHKKQDHPQLLLPIINELRVARKAKAFPESHFFDVDSEGAVDVASILGISAENKLGDYEHHAKRFRHMYQVGLLDVLKEGNDGIGLRLIQRSAMGCAKLTAGEPLSHFWVLVHIVSDVMAKRRMDLSDIRKRVFMRIEKYLREMALVGKVVGSKSAPDSLIKELLYLLALSGDDTDQTLSVLAKYGVEELGINDQVLQAESKRLFGPGIDVLRSLSKALQEEMIQLKDKLDILERGGDPGEEDFIFIANSLERLSGTLSMLDLPKISALCDEQTKLVKSWQESNKLVSEDQLLSVADAVITIEMAINRFEETGIQPDIDLDANSSERGVTSFLTEARIVVISESQSGMALTKRAITSFVESSGDKLHLANVAQVMDSIRGGMQMIGQERLAQVIQTCMQCINQELYENEQQPDVKILETLADAMSSLEYYIESMNYKESPNQELLKIGEDSLKSIGY